MCVCKGLHLDVPRATRCRISRPLVHPERPHPERPLEVDSAYAQLSFTTPTKPALLSGKPAVDAEADEAYQYLIMPVRLSG